MRVLHRQLAAGVFHCGAKAADGATGTANPINVTCGMCHRAVAATEEALLVEFTDIVKARSPEAWQLLHVGTVKELVRVAVERLRDAP